MRTRRRGPIPAAWGLAGREDVYTFLLVGRDDGQGGGGNTDTMMVGCYDVKNGTVDVLSIYGIPCGCAGGDSQDQLGVQPTGH